MITVSNSLNFNNNKTTDYNKIILEKNIYFGSGDNQKQLEFKKDGRIFYNGTQIYYNCKENCVSCDTCYDTCQTCAGTCYNCTACTMCVDCHGCTTCDGCVNCNEHCNACTGCHGCTDDNNCYVNCYGWCTCCNSCTWCASGLFSGCSLCFNRYYGCPCNDCNDTCYQFQTEPPKVIGSTSCNGAAEYSGTTTTRGCDTCDTCRKCNACNGVCTSCFGCYVCNDRCYSND